MSKRSYPPISFKLVLWTASLALPAMLGAQDTANRTVSVLYAGSLGAVMENGIGPAFIKATGYSYQGEAQGSLGAAQMIRDHVRRPDVFISSDPNVNVNVLMGPKNGGKVKWFTILASAQLVLAYNPHSKFAQDFERAKADQIPWYELLEKPGVRFGRGDPSIDPKGYRTLFLFQLASVYYHRPDIAGLPGSPLNPSQVFPEVVLTAKLESGQFDAGFFYKHEAVAHKLPYISLPAEINQGDPHLASFYGQASYTTPAGTQMKGAPILFTVTIPEMARHREAAIAFVRFLLSSDGLLKEFGFGNIDHQSAGDMDQFPTELRGFSAGVFQP
jgi:molybdate/tungstate transport system substrate-binding protein